MKMFLKYIFFIICLTFFKPIHSQVGIVGDPFNLVHPDKSVLFGFDTYINNQPNEDQKNIAICSAFNGWLYGVYSYYDDTVHKLSLIHI